MTTQLKNNTTQTGATTATPKTKVFQLNLASAMITVMSRADAAKRINEETAGARSVDAAQSVLKRSRKEVGGLPLITDAHLYSENEEFVNEKADAIRAELGDEAPAVEGAAKKAKSPKATFVLDRAGNYGEAMTVPGAAARIAELTENLALGSYTVQEATEKLAAGDVIAVSSGAPGTAEGENWLIFGTKKSEVKNFWREHCKPAKEAKQPREKKEKAPKTPAAPKEATGAAATVLQLTARRTEKNPIRRTDLPGYDEKMVALRLAKQGKIKVTHDEKGRAMYYAVNPIIEATTQAGDAAQQPSA